MRDEFLHRKQQVLNKGDKSSVGFWDEKIQLLCETINKSDDMYTTSSCSGRIIVKQLQIEKQQDVFLFASHDLVEFEEIQESVSSVNESKFPLELLQESLILHVAIRDIEKAVRIICIAKQCGCNQCGIISVKHWGVIVEIICDIKLQSLILDKSFFESSMLYFKELLVIMNENLKRNWSVIDTLELELK